MYCSVRGIKVPCTYLWRKYCSLHGYKTLFENIALFSLQLNGIFLFLQLEVITLDLDPENSFVKKRTRFSLTETTLLRSTRKNINGQAG